MRSNYWNRVLGWLAVLAIAITSGACSGNLIPVTGNIASNTVTLSGCYQIRFLGFSKNNQAATTTWRYQVDELPCAVQQLSDWMVALPACAVVVDASPASWEVLQPDPVLQSNAVKWKTPEEFQGGEFRLELSGALVRGSVLAGVKAPNEAVSLIQGPVCDPDAPAPTATFTSTPTTTATSTIFPSPTALSTSTSTLIPYFPPVEPTETNGPSPTRTSPAPVRTSTAPPNTATLAPIITSTAVPPNTPVPGPTNTSPPVEDTETAEPVSSEPTRSSSRPPTKTPKP